ncbi:MAG: hypothetical protein GX911_01720, partial [Spirochaetales bacterium]|nr:hypothetical protein [Spirochaetales bacterium]
IGALLNNEKSIKSTTQKLEDAKKELSDKLILGQVKKGSLVYQAQDQAIRLSEGTLKSLEASRDLLIRQFESIVGVPYPDEITDIREPDLSLAMNAEGSTSVASKRIDVQKAKETLALRKAQYTNKNLVVGGNISYTNSETMTNIGPKAQNHLTLGGSAALAGKGFSVQGAVGGTYDFDKGTLTPVVAISGAWSNDPASAKDELEIRQLENEVLLAEIAYNNAVDEHIQSSIEVQNGIASWQLEYALLLQTIRYNEDLLKQQRELFENGLVTKKQVEDAVFTVEQDEYELKALLLKGLQLENEIKRLMI